MSYDQTLTSTLQRGDETAILLQMQNRGVPTWLWLELKGDRLADVVATLLFRRILFATPEEQAARMLQINEHVWKDPAITPEAIHALGPPPEWPLSGKKALSCLTLMYHTGDALKTFKRGWDACVCVHGGRNILLEKGIDSSPGFMRPRRDASPRPAGLFWAVVELGRGLQGWDAAASCRPDLRHGKIVHVGEELPQIAAMHPMWAMSMDGFNIPFVYGADFELSQGGSGKKFKFVPQLCLCHTANGKVLQLGPIPRGGGSKSEGPAQFREIQAGQPFPVAAS